MPEAVLVGQQPQILLRGVGVAFAAAGQIVGPGPRAVSEFSRLTAVFVIATGGSPAAGFPRIVQSVDGVSVDLITALTLDTTQTHAVVYTGDVSLLLPYVFVQYTNSGTPTTIDYLVQGWPAGASSGSSGGGGGGGGGGNAPTGSVLSFAGAAAPSGWLLTDGTVYNIATYPTLGALLGATYGGDGVTTFGVPDTRGRSSLGAGTGGGLTPRTLGAVGGEELHVLTDPELATHTHLGVAVFAATLGAGLDMFTGASLTTNGAMTTTSAGPLSIGDAGSDTGHNTMHPFLVLNSIIKT